MLLAGTCDVFGTPAGFIARSRIVPLGAVVGRPSAAALERLLADVPAGFELLLHDVGDLRPLKREIPDWTVWPATVHVPGDAVDPAPAGRLDIRIADPPDAPSVYALPEPWRLWAAASAALATVWADGQAVTVCEAVAVTETWWEVGISTREPFRRRGYARAAFRALDAHMTGRGLTAVWGALDTNQASLGLARRLGFRPVERLWLMRPPQ